MMNETIAAIATPFGAGGLGVVRISGGNALTVADKVVRTASGHSVVQMTGYTCAYGHVYDGDEVLDEVVVTVFRAPHSFTGENVAELSVHGSTPVLERLLQVCIRCGAVLAAAGEFTKRAFLNGKMDLAQAEAIADLIAAEDIHAAKAARVVKSGRLSKLVGVIRDLLLEQASDAAAWVDFPDEATDVFDESASLLRLEQCEQMLVNLIAGFHKGQMLQKGIRTAIIGKPNVGKSTLMNYLCGLDRSIISNIPGTTRDVVTESVQLGSMTLRLADTAGVRNTKDPVESIGVHRALQEALDADLVLVVLDASKPLDSQDHHVIASLGATPIFLILNKSDLPPAFQLEDLWFPYTAAVRLSAKKGEGIGTLDKMLSEHFKLGVFDSQGVYLANLRQYGCATSALQSVQDAMEALHKGLTWDVIGVCVEEALSHLLELTGENVNQRVIDDVFNRFCVGK